MRQVTEPAGRSWVFPARSRKPQVIWLRLIAARGSSAPGSAGGPSDVHPEVAREDPPSDLPQTPEPPTLQPAAEAQFLDYPEARRRLRQMELGLDDHASAAVQDRAHEQIVAAALAAIGDPASQRKLLPAAPESPARADSRHQ